MVHRHSLEVHSELALRRSTVSLLPPTARAVIWGLSTIESGSQCACMRPMTHTWLYVVNNTQTDTHVTQTTEAQQPTSSPWSSRRTRSVPLDEREMQHTSASRNFPCYLICPSPCNTPGIDNTGRLPSAKQDGVYARRDARTIGTLPHAEHALHLQ